MTDIVDLVLAGPTSAVVVGFGVANRAVARALQSRGHQVTAVDDQTTKSNVDAAAALNVDLVPSEARDGFEAVIGAADFMIPTPGLPEWHPAFQIAHATTTPIGSEFDLARAWDSRPIAAITGTNGKTTVVELCVAALNESGKAAASAGNTEVPLVEAIDDPLPEIFVVEASSFRLAQSQRFAPQVGCWLNFAPDHLDVHRDLASYEAAKARIWADLPDGAAAVANASDPVVMRHVPAQSSLTFSTTSDADWQLDGASLTGPSGEIIDVDDLWRSHPHDVEDALAASAVATFMGATPEGLRTALTDFQLAAHRVQFVGEIDGAFFYNDSKATTPHATVAALRSFSQAVLIAGGRNKGIDLSPLRDAADHVHAVIAIGEAASDIVDVFAGLRPVEIAADMDDAVERAATAAGSGMTVVLSPACASFDWYANYGARGDDFARAVADLANRVSRGAR